MSLPQYELFRHLCNLSPYISAPILPEEGVVGPKLHGMGPCQQELVTALRACFAMHMHPVCKRQYGLHVMKLVITHSPS